jgi:hypothetical protein
MGLVRSSEDESENGTKFDFFRIFFRFFGALTVKNG